MSPARTAYLQRYLDTSGELMRQLPLGAVDAVIRALLDAREAGRFIYVMGNGGSAANAEHFVNDLGKGERRGFPRRFKILSLSSNLPLLTAWANDTDYEHVFAEQLRNFVGPGDVAMAISGSGNSANVVTAIELARKLGAVTVGLTGFDGGKLKPLCDHCVVVPSDNMQHIEELHLVVLHAIYAAIRDTDVTSDAGDHAG